MSLVDLFSALADPTRCRVVEMLHGRPRPVHELAAAFDISRPAISRHLKVLKDAGLVVEEKAGRENVYSLQRAQLKPMQDWLERHRTQKATRKPATQPEVAAVAATAETARPVPEPVTAIVSIAAAPGQRGRTPRTPKSPRAVVVAPPSVAAPQLSFFDL